MGPSYLIFPIISLSPLVTIALSAAFLRERTGRIGVVGIVPALAALPLFNDWTPGGGTVYFGLWFFLSLVILVSWGLQNYFIKIAHASMSTGAIFFYMTLGGLLLVPVARTGTRPSTGGSTVRRSRRGFNCSTPWERSRSSTRCGTARRWSSPRSPMRPRRCSRP
jgi:drug/metabolite transporter (DMT)-like permease